MSAYALELSDTELARYRRMAERARAVETDLWAAAGIAAGAHIADIGCGPGAMLAVLADVAGPTGHVTGVDRDENALAAARSQLDAKAIANAEVRIGRADDTGLEPGSFDVAVLRHVLAHNGGAEQSIVNHLASLVRPGGALLLADTDLASHRMPSAPASLHDLFDNYLAFHRLRGNDPGVGMRLPELAREAGLEVVVYRGWFSISEASPGFRPPAWAARAAMVAAGVVSDDDVARWGKDFGRLDAQTPRPLFFASLFAAVCRRPCECRQ